MIDEVDPALYQIEQETQPASQRLDYVKSAPRSDYVQAAPRSDYVPEYAPAPSRQSLPPIKKPVDYVPASGPAFSSPSFATARQDLGPGALEAAVVSGAQAYGAAVGPVSTIVVIAIAENERHLAIMAGLKCFSPLETYFRKST